MKKKQLQYLFLSLTIISFVVGFFWPISFVITIVSLYFFVRMMIKNNKIIHTNTPIQQTQEMQEIQNNENTFHQHQEHYIFDETKPAGRNITFETSLGTFIVPAQGKGTKCNCYIYNAMDLSREKREDTHLISKIEIKENPKKSVTFIKGMMIDFKKGFWETEWEEKYKGFFPFVVEIRKI